MHAPPMPHRAATWLITSLLGRSNVETLWTAVWFHGVLSGAILAAVGVLAVNLLVVNVLILTRGTKG